MDDAFLIDVTISTWAGEAVEKLNNTLQHMEAIGNCMQDLTYRRGPLQTALHELFRRATSTDTPFGCDFVVDAICGESETIDPVQAERQAFAAITDIYSQVFIRVLLVVKNSPWDLIGHVDPRLSIAEQEAARADIVRKNICCSAPGMGEEVGRAVQENEFVVDELGAKVFPVIGNLTPATNFGVERLLALMRAATPRLAGRKPRASHVLSCGMNGQLMQQHLAIGLPDKRGHEKRKDLIMGPETSGLGR